MSRERSDDEGAVGGSRTGSQEVVEDREIKQEPDQGGELREQLSRLEAIVAQQAQTIQVMGQQLLNQNVEVEAPARSPRVGVKPRDIPVLDLLQLGGIEAAGNLNIFFDLVEACTPVEEERLSVVKTRISSEIALLLRNRQSQGTAQTWEGVKGLFREEFAAEVNFDRAWQEIESMRYNWGDSPQVFTNELNCKYALIESTFPNEKIPSKDQLIKRKLWRGMALEAKEKLETFLGEGYPLNKFIDRVEFERQFLLGRAPQFVCTVPDKKVEKLDLPKTPLTPPTSDMDDLKAQLKSLAEKVERLGKDKTFCPYCRSNTHDLRNCSKCPAPGTCFDCLRPNCRRGSPGCPGKAIKKD